MSDTYRIIRCHHPRLRKSVRIIKWGLTLEDAQEHCRREDTRKESFWFDGYEREETEES